MSDIVHKYQPKEDGLGDCWRARGEAGRTLIKYSHYRTVKITFSIWISGCAPMGFLLDCFLNFPFFHYSKVPNNSTARLLIFKIFSYQHGLIWTYMIIKIQIVFLPTRLLSTILNFFSIFKAFWSLFFCYNSFNNAFIFMYFHPFISF